MAFVDAHSDTTFGAEEIRLNQIERTYNLPVGIAVSLARFNNHKGPQHEVFKLDNGHFLHVDFETGWWLTGMTPVKLLLEVLHGRDVERYGMDFPDHVAGALYAKVFEKVFAGRIE